MTRDSRDELDRAIDDVLASMVAGEPRRVDAASVRKAVGERRAFRVPVWLAAAAILVVAFGVWTRGRSVAPLAPASVARSTAPKEPTMFQPASAPAVGEGALSPLPAPSRAEPSGIESWTGAPFEGLPRIVIAAIERPEPLTTPPLAAEALVITPIEIPALSVSALSYDPEQPQEKPQS